MDRVRRILTIAWNKVQQVVQDYALAACFLLPLLIASMMAGMNLSLSASARGQEGAILVHLGLVSHDSAV